MIIRNNVLEGGRGGSPAIGLWSGRPYNNIVICHNVLRYYGEKTGGWTGAIYGGNAEAQGYAIVNNIIDGLGGMVLRKADLHHNMFTCFGAVMNEASLGDNLYEPDLSKVFVDAARGDYRLHPKALAIDYGTLVGTINRFDRVGVDRSQFGKPDIGPYEYVENGHSPETLKQADPSTFRFSMGGYTIRPAPEREIVYESPFKSVEDGEKHEMLGLDFTNEGGGKVATRPTRGGYICMWDKPGHWLEWTVEVDKPGFYELVLTFASEMPSKRSVLLNGKPVDRLEAVAFPATGAWRAFEKKGLPVALELVEGKNTIRFTNVTGSLNFRNLQFVQVVPPSEK